MPRRAYPASPPIYQDPEKLAAQIRRTDSALTSWRDVSVDRRKGWEERREAEQRVLARRRRIVVGTALAVGLVATGIAAAVVVWGGSSEVVPSTAAATPAAPAMVAAAPPTVTVIESVLPPTPVPVAEAPAAPAPVTLTTGIVEAGTASVTADADHVWAAFHTKAAGLVQFRYFDGAGVEALEPMGCPRRLVDGVRHCEAGRSADRVKAAIVGGAAPGSWAVRACAGDACEEIGRFDVP
jgi:hypothetical protein